LGIFPVKWREATFRQRPRAVQLGPECRSMLIP
jgi:hypothetical protein